MSRSTTGGGTGGRGDGGGHYADEYADEGDGYQGDGYEGEYSDDRDAYGGYAHDGDAHDDGHDDDDYDDGSGSGRVRGSGSGTEGDLSNRVFTIPNLISVARLAGVPLFLGLILSPYYGGPKYDGWALAVLMFAGFSDWLDGKLARRWNQMTKLGTFLDPLADRLYIFATLIGFTIRGIIPIWLVVLLVGRDVLLLTLVPKLRRAGYGNALPVHFLGKAATFNLLYAFPLLLLGQIGDSHGAVANFGHIFGWAFAGWGAALYLWAGALYFVQARQVTRAALTR